MAEVLWTAPYQFGRPVSLTSEGLAHILEEHHDMAPWIPSLEEVVTNAEAIERDPRFAHRLRRYLRVDSNLRIRVVVHYAPTPAGWVGTIRTAHLFQRSITGELVWP